MLEAPTLRMVRPCTLFLPTIVEADRKTNMTSQRKVQKPIKGAARRIARGFLHSRSTIRNSLFFPALQFWPSGRMIFLWKLFPAIIRLTGRLFFMRRHRHSCHIALCFVSILILLWIRSARRLDPKSVFMPPRMECWKVPLREACDKGRLAPKFCAAKSTVISATRKRTSFW